MSGVRCLTGGLESSSFILNILQSLSIRVKDTQYDGEKLYKQTFKEKVSFYWALVFKHIHLLFDESSGPHFYPMQKEMFNMTNLCILLGKTF